MAEPTPIIDALGELIEEIATTQCDFHRGIKDKPEQITYCFTCVERYTEAIPCVGERIRRAADAVVIALTEAEKAMPS